jgi:hypothetical protein
LLTVPRCPNLRSNHGSRVGTLGHHTGLDSVPLLDDSHWFVGGGVFLASKSTCLARLQSRGISHSIRCTDRHRIQVTFGDALPNHFNVGCGTEFQRRRNFAGPNLEIEHAANHTSRLVDVVVQSQWHLGRFDHARGQ